MVLKSLGCHQTGSTAYERTSWGAGPQVLLLRSWWSPKHPETLRIVPLNARCFVRIGKGSILKRKHTNCMKLHHVYNCNYSLTGKHRFFPMWISNRIWMSWQHIDSSKRMSCGARLRMRQHIPKRHSQQTGGEFLPRPWPLGIVKWITLDVVGI